MIHKKVKSQSNSDDCGVFGKNSLQILMTTNVGDRFPSPTLLFEPVKLSLERRINLETSILTQKHQNHLETWMLAWKVPS